MWLQVLQCRLAECSRVVGGVANSVERDHPEVLVPGEYVGGGYGWSVALGKSLTVLELKKLQLL